MNSPLLKVRSSYEILDTIGSGAFGVVNKIKIKDSEQVYALKEISLKKLSSREEKDALLAQSKSEYAILKKGFENVVKSYGSLYDEGKEAYLFTMEYHPKNLKDHVKEVLELKKEIKFDTFMKIFKNILKGMRSLYVEGKTIHRDIKPENILINFQGEAILGDVGVAKTFNSANISLSKAVKKLTSIAGTDVWMPPEVIKIKESNTSEFSSVDQSKLDIFSLGLVSLFILDAEQFSTQNDWNRNEEKLFKYLDSLSKRIQVPPLFFYILRCMVSFSHFLRPDIQTLYNDIMTIFPDKESLPNDSSSGEALTTSADKSSELMNKVLEDKKILEIFQLLKLKNSKSLSINFDSNKIINDEIIRLYSIEIKGMTALEDLELIFSDTCISDEALKSLMESFSSITSLKKIVLRLGDCTSITCVGISNFIDALCSLNNLEMVELFLRNNKSNFSSKEFTALGQSLSGLNKLQSIIIGIESWSVKEDSLAKFGEALTKLQNLKRLKLNLSDVDIPKKAMQEFANKLKFEVKIEA